MALIPALAVGAWLGMVAFVIVLALSLLVLFGVFALAPEWWE